MPTSTRSSGCVGCLGWAARATTHGSRPRPHARRGRPPTRNSPGRSVPRMPVPAAAQVPDLVKRDFTASHPDEKWCGDITYVPVGESGFVYFATVIDLYSGRLIGWSVAEHMRAELVQGALAAAVATRGGN